MNYKINNKFDNWDNPNHSGNFGKEQNSLIIVGQILTMIAAFVWCLSIIGILWGIPMILGCRNRLNGTKKITITHVVIAILFYGAIGAVLTLVGAQQEKKLA